MAEERSESREVTWRQLLPWTELFRTFQVALDLNKLLLAAAGIFVTWFLWWLLALIFAAPQDKTAPDWLANAAKYDNNWATYRKERQRWNLMNEAVGLDANVANPDKRARYKVEDFAETKAEFTLFTQVVDLEQDVHEAADKRDARELYLATISDLAKKPKDGDNEEEKARFKKKLADWEAKKKKLEGNPNYEWPSLPLSPEEERLYRAKASQYARLSQPKPYGLLAVSPWNEDRGPNPYLLVTGQSGVPWEPGFFWEWFGREQAPVMVEPLVKFLRPIVYFLSPVNDWVTRFYFGMVVLCTLVVWSIFGGAITRIAVVQLARGEKIGVFEALRFTSRRFLSYAIAPLFVLGFCFVLTLIMVLLYLVGMIPYVGDFVTAVIYPLYFVLGLIMAVAFVGLVGWPLMAATISAEGTDSWEAVSRSYSYVYQRPWHFIWYSLVSIAYGGVCLFFIGFMVSFSVYLAKWGMNQTPGSGYFEREPHYLFVYAPESFGWRELLLDGAQVTEYQKKPKYAALAARKAEVVLAKSSRPAGEVGAGRSGRWSRLDENAYEAYVRESLTWGNHLGAAIVAFWLGLVFLLMLGFGYSFFWTSSTIIYLLLRKSVDAAEMDEVYLEEDDYEQTFPPGPPATAVTPMQAGRSLPMVDAPRPTAVSAPGPVAPSPPPSAGSAMISTPAPAPPAPVTPSEPPKPSEPAKPPEKQEGPSGEPEKPAEDGEKPQKPAEGGEKPPLR